jgi:hypothetical protein
VLSTGIGVEVTAAGDLRLEGGEAVRLGSGLTISGGLTVAITAHGGS